MVIIIGNVDVDASLNPRLDRLLFPLAPMPLPTE